MFGPYGSEFIFTDSANLAYWNAQSVDAGTSIIEAVPTLGFSRLNIVWTRSTPVGTREDVATTTFAFAQTAGSACTPLSGTDKTAVESTLSTWWTAFKSAISNQWTLDSYRWYDYQPITNRPGPVDKVTSVGVAGGAASARNADQLAQTCTYLTPSRKHWGRSYFPLQGPPSTTLDLVYGRMANAYVDAQANDWAGVLRVSGGSGIISPVVASIKYHGVLSIKELQVDNIIDVVRRRRAKQASYRKQLTS